MKKIHLSRNMFSIVDDEDYEELNRFKWCANKGGNTFYAKRHSSTINGKRHNIHMHRIITSCPDDMQVDHINGNGLDNRKENLRVVTNRQNSQNLHIKKTSQYPGVDWHPQDKRWRSNIVVNGKQYSLGQYDTEQEAYFAYLKAYEELSRLKSLKLTIDQTDFPYNIGLKIQPAKCKTSKYIGVGWDKSVGKWVVRIRFDGNRYNLGSYETEEEAAHTYALALKYRGDKN